jgi:LysR family glycine cleavage system transcriptional activator
MPPKKRRLPSLNWLRAFEAAARHTSFAEAAKELTVTPAAISQQVKQLEDWLGTALFTRQPRSLTLTDAGHGYLPIVRQAFDHLAAGTQDLFGSGRSGPVAVRVSTSLTYLWLVPRLASFLSRYPDVSLRLTTTVDGLAFGQADADLEIRYGNGQWPGFRADRLFWEALIPVCSPALLRGPVPLAKPDDLANHTLIHMIGEPENWQMWLNAAGVSGLSVGSTLQFDLHMMATRAAIEGIGVALGLSPMVDDALVDGRLVAPFDITIPARDAHFVVTPEEAINRREVQLFKTWLLEEARSHDRPFDPKAIGDLVKRRRKAPLGPAKKSVGRTPR